MRWSIRYRLFVPLGLLLLGVVGISAWSANAAAAHAEQRIAKQVRSVTQTLAGASFSLTPRILEQMKGLSGAEYLHIDAEDIRTSTFREHDIKLPPEIAAQPAEDGSADQLGLPIEIEGQRYRCRRLPLKTGGNLFIFYPESSLNEAIRDAVRPSLVFGLFGGLASVALMLLISRRFVNRIRDLERRTRQIAAGDFSPMPLPTQNDELRDLSQSVNDMAERLAHLQEAVQKNERLRLIGQLSSGLAHQLRNSVTGAKLAVQLHVGECPLVGDEALDVTLRQLNLMEANLRRFMDLGKSESRPREVCSIPALIEEIVALLRPQCRHAGTDLHWNPPEQPLEVEGDANQLRDLFLNVIGNAIEAAGAGGAVEIVLGVRSASKASSDSPLLALRAPESVIIEISDTGPGPPTAIAERLFEPFVTGKPEGIGLGLAVARQVVESHGGSIEWRRENGRTVFRIGLREALSEPEA